MSRRCETRVAAIAAMSSLEVQANWEQERARPAPAISPSLLARDLAFDLQVAAHVRLSIVVHARDAAHGE
jgi:hypothetical protein